MRTLLFTVLLTLTPLACSKSADKPAGAQAGDEMIVEAVPSISVDELDKQLAAGTSQAVDANGPGTRKKLGIIPGAVLLTDYEAFQPSELPADKSRTLVFYCANTQCSASHEAAQRAITAGYKNVKVLPEGIAGWKQAGKQTATVGS